MTATETALQLMRACIRQAYGLTASQVIPGDVRGPRPQTPYLTVRVNTSNVPIGEGVEVVQSPLDVVTVTLSTPGTVYTITVDGTAYSYTSVTDDTAATIALALAATLFDLDAGIIAATDGADVLIYGEAGALTVSVGAHLALVTDTSVEIYREGVYATLTVQGFGEGSATWLEGLPGALARPDVTAIQDTYGMDLDVDGGLMNVAQLLDTAFEPRWARGFQASYTIVHIGLRAAASGGNPTGSPIIVPLVPLLIVEMGYIGATDDSDADPVTFTLTQEVQ